jgi:hypothetical protein
VEVRAMVKIDLFISIGIVVAGVGMSLVGIEMTIHPPDAKSQAKWYRGSFIILGLVFIGLNIWQFERAAVETQRLADKHQEEQIRNEGNIKFVQGQLDTMTKALSGLSANSSPQQILSVLKQIRPSGVEPPAIQRMTHSQLREKVIAFANELRKLNVDQRRDSMSESMALQQRLREAPADQRKVISQDNTNQMLRFNNEQSLFISTNYVGPATEYRDELLRRLGPQEPNEEEVHMYFWYMGGAGLNNLSSNNLAPTAEYLERLARMLPKDTKQP